MGDNFPDDCCRRAVNFVTTHAIHHFYFFYRDSWGGKCSRQCKGRAGAVG